MYDRLAQFYEWEHGRFQDDVPLYLGFAQAARGPILDAACGTGRVLAALAESGYTVCGVDISPAMLGIAAARVGRGTAASRVRLVCADIRTMDLGRSYAMALVALGSFHHLLTADAQREALARLAAHMDPGGLLVLDLENPSPGWLAAGDGALVHQISGPFPEPDGPDRLSKFVARTTRFEDQMEHTLLIYDRSNPEGAVTRQSFEMGTRFLFRYEAEHLLAEAGFRVRNLFGDYELQGYHGDSPRMVFVAERR